MVKSLESINTLEKKTGHWTAKEHEKFMYGKIMKMKWDEIAKYIGTRTSHQCRSHYQKIKDNGSNFRGLSVLMHDKATQYEPPTSFFASKEVILQDSQICSPGTKASEDCCSFEDFQFICDDVCEDLLVI